MGVAVEIIDPASITEADRKQAQRDTKALLAKDPYLRQFHRPASISDLGTPLVPPKIDAFLPRATEHLSIEDYLAEREATKGRAKPRAKKGGPGQQTTMKTLTELYESELEMPPCVIDKLLPMGLYMLVATPKVGKTRLLLKLADSVAKGTKALGRFDVTQGHVMYYALEDGWAGFKQSAKSLGIKPNDNLSVSESLLNLSSGGMEQIRAEAAEHPDLRIIVIDVFNRVKQKRNGTGDIYQDDADSLTPLHSLAKELGVAIILVHHTNKNVLDAIKSHNPVLAVSGTQAIAGTVDGIWLLHREKNEGCLLVTGRFVEEQELPLTFGKNGAWELTDSDRTEDEGAHGNGLPNFTMFKTAEAEVAQILEEEVGEDYRGRKELLERVYARATVSASKSYLERVVDNYLPAQVELGRFEGKRFGQQRKYRRANPA